MFTCALDVRKGKPIQLEINDFNETTREFTGWASVEGVDKEGEIIPIDEMKKIMNIWMRRGAPIMYGHSNQHIGKGLNWTLEKKGELDGIKISGQVFSDIPMDDEVWEKVKTNEITGLSFGGRSHEKEDSIDSETKEKVRTLGKLEPFEISLVETPANDGALLESVNYLAKGIDNKDKQWILTDGKSVYKVSVNKEYFEKQEVQKGITKKELNEFLEKVLEASLKKIKDRNKLKKKCKRKSVRGRLGRTRPRKPFGKNKKGLTKADLDDFNEKITLKCRKRQ